MLLMTLKKPKLSEVELNEFVFRCELLNGGQQ